jgi:hypothetical protein
MIGRVGNAEVYGWIGLGGVMMAQRRRRREVGDMGRWEDGDGETWN